MHSYGLGHQSTRGQYPLQLACLIDKTGYLGSLFRQMGFGGVEVVASLLWKNFLKFYVSFLWRENSHEP